MAVSTLRAGYSLGEHTLFVPNDLFALNRRRICERLRDIKEVPENAYILLQGGDNISDYDTDVDYIFRQEPFFQWSFGVKEPGCYAAVEVKTAKSFLFVPKFPDFYTIWMGPPNTLRDFKELYSVDEVHYACDIADVLTNLKVNVLLILNGINSDSGLAFTPPSFEGMKKFTVDENILYTEMSECRVIKTELELDILRYVNKISSDAHIHVMRTIRSGMFEYQCESLFCNFVYLVGGCRRVGYTCICGSGHQGSVLHYGHAAAPNDKQIKDGDMCLFDMGAKYCGYTADITISFPVNGKFTKDQVAIYNAVLKANQAVMNTARAGVSWVDMHILANRTMLSELKDAGLLQGDVDEMLKAEMGFIFQPHGLGHFLGVDVHDAGGYILGRTPDRPTERSTSKLRTARVLKEGMVITIEPGCYFIDMLLDEALADPIKSKFMVPEVIERFRNFGGVRIEDDVIIKKDGVENMTKVPRTIEEIEAVLADKVEPVPAAPLGKYTN